jgi:hypothetical protein
MEIYAQFTSWISSVDTRDIPMGLLVGGKHQIAKITPDDSDKVLNQCVLILRNNTINETNPWGIDVKCL